MLHVLHLLVVLVHLWRHARGVAHHWEAGEVLQALRLFHGATAQLMRRHHVRSGGHGAHVHLLHVRGDWTAVQIPQRLHVRLFVGLVLAGRGLFLRLFLDRRISFHCLIRHRPGHVRIAQIVVAAARAGSAVRARV